MIIEKVTRLLFPKEQYSKLKTIYRKLKEQYHKRISINEFRDILINDLGLKKGSVVFIHSSVYNLFLDFEPEKALDIIIDVVGDEGTIVMPCNQLQERAEDYLLRDKIFDVKKTLTKMGLLPGLAMFHKLSWRSLHPTNSCVAIGKYAKDILSSHQDSIYPCGELSPYYKIMHYNGIIIGLGVSTDSLTFVHVIEDIMKDDFPVQTRIETIFKAKVKDYDNNILIVETLAAHENTRYRDVKGFIKKHIPSKSCIDFKKHGISFFKADSVQLFQKMMNLANANITIYSKEVYKVNN